ncbi:hypothetical protein LBSG162_06460 [Lentilactobacillus buchneri subsp. silagei]|nr:hypothetical protein Ltb232_10080 [Lentilactobacillus buchneri subsp. silagei]GED91541.1 hypothetical protein LBSG162_06460 [Lentilactobacillus buchneri subsp. silagei]GED94228.1 hypothetical protein LBSP_07880 [Lentilactobacillus buchneri subsp. silagei]
MANRYILQENVYSDYNSTQRKRLQTLYINNTNDCVLLKIKVTFTVLKWGEHCKTLNVNDPSKALQRT